MILILKKFVEQHVESVKNVQNLNNDQQCNGPQGTVSHKTFSIKLLHSGLERCRHQMRKFPELSINLASLVTTVVENIHAVYRMKHETFTVLEYAQDFRNIVKESLKHSTVWSIKYFTNPKTYYPLPSTSAALHDT